MDNAAKDGGISHTTGLPAFNAATSVLGAPTITLPLMAVDGLPVGVQLIGQMHTDATLSALAGWVQGAVAPVRV
jgi:Asp-tRNA(Asn)/Glu-tRNA(Gln) amidotransferase A subunit family amidase